MNGLWQFAFGAPEGAAFTVWEASWLVVQSLLLVGVVGLALSGAAGLFGAVSLGVALLGRVVFVVSETHSLAIGEESGL
ncbi:MAG: hypothetical protein ACRDSJ_11625 [Rubrobacteraceae bacterium]